MSGDKEHCYFFCEGCLTKMSVNYRAARIKDHGWLCIGCMAKRMKRAERENEERREAAAAKAAKPRPRRMRRSPKWKRENI